MKIFICLKIDYYELKAIQAYVEKVVSPFAKVEIVNTTFEKVKITGHIKVSNKLDTRFIYEKTS